MNSPKNPTEALAALKEGNGRWVSGALLHPNHDAESREMTAADGQNPLAAVLACSDSRVSPLAVFDQGIGDIFEVRVAGNVAGRDVLGSIAFAVHELHTPLVVVLGHTKCGALTAALGGKLPSGRIPYLVDKVRPMVEAARQRLPDQPESDWVDHAAELNVRKVCQEIPEESPVVRKALEEGQVKVVGGVYDIGTGQVTWLT